MRTICYVLFLLVLVGSIYAQPNFTFSIRPGGIINTADFGLNMGNLTPFVGADVLWITVNYKNQDYDDDEYYNYYGAYAYYNHYISTDIEEFEGSAFLFIPHFGAKFSLGSQDDRGNVNPYVKANLFLSIPSVSAKWTDTWDEWVYSGTSPSNITDTEHYYDYDEDELTGGEKDFIEDVLSFWGIEAALGADYYFSQKFSIGGEFGLRMLFNSAKGQDSDYYSYEDPDYYWEHDTDAWEQELSASFKITYGAIVLNYNF
jgi:hypothetical protein